jgi:hypothetical protein
MSMQYRYKLNITAINSVWAEIAWTSNKEESCDPKEQEGEASYLIKVGLRKERLFGQ